MQPVSAVRSCCRDDSLHNRWVNSKALELIGITNETPNPADGEIVRDGATGEAVGLLVEKASSLAEKVVFASIEDPMGRDMAHRPGALWRF